MLPSLSLSLSLSVSLSHTPHPHTYPHTQTQTDAIVNKWMMKENNMEKVSISQRIDKEVAALIDIGISFHMFML